MNPHHGRMTTKTRNKERYCPNHLERVLLPGHDVCKECEAEEEKAETARQATLDEQHKKIKAAIVSLRDALNFPPLSEQKRAGIGLESEFVQLVRLACQQCEAARDDDDSKGLDTSDPKNQHVLEDFLLQELLRDGRIPD